MQRRQFLGRLGATAAAAGVLPGVTREALAQAPGAGPVAVAAGDWRALRELFALDRGLVHLASFLLASHPRPVAEAIERHRRGLDANPAEYVEAHEYAAELAARQAAARYMGARPEEIALTGSTTMGLGLVYGGLRLVPGDEVLSTVHDHYSTQVALAHRAARDGAQFRQIALYDEPATANTSEVIARLRAAVTPRTRALAITWVHSGTGVKLPVRAIADLVSELNAARNPDARILLCVDGVHGFGVESESMEQLGCDFFIAGTHKWIFGPRGTGLVWGRTEAWHRVSPSIPSFGLNYGAWLGLLPQELVAAGDLMSPGGFHAFEHRWALPEAFDLHLQLGKDAVTRRIHGLNTRTKQALAGMKHVKLLTPVPESLSSGLVCFEVAGVAPAEVVKRLRERGIIASTTPYRARYARLAPSLLNDENEIDRVLAEIRAMA